MQDDSRTMQDPDAWACQVLGHQVRDYYPAKPWYLVEGLARTIWNGQHPHCSWDSVAHVVRSAWWRANVMEGQDT